MKLTDRTATTPARSSRTVPRETKKWHYEIAAGFPVFAGLLAIIAWLLAHTLLRNIAAPPASIEELRGTLVPGIRDLLNPEPVERWLFILLVLASPGCILAGLGAVRAMRGYFPVVGERFLGCVALMAGSICIYMLHGKSLFLFFVFPVSPLLDSAILYAAGALLFMIAWKRGPVCMGAIGTNCPNSFQIPAAAIVACAVVMLPRGLGIPSVLDSQEMSPFGWEAHFQAIAYPLSQVFAGKPLLTAAPPLYGYNAEFLLPVFKCIGLSVFKFCIVMALIQFVALFSVLAIAIRHVRLQVVRFLCCAALLYFIGSTCLVGRRPFDPVFQYWPIRFIFPALSVPVFLCVLRRSRASSWLALGVFAGLGLMWNLDSGIAVAGAVLFTLALETIARYRDSGVKTGHNQIRHLSLVAGSLVITITLFWLFLQIQSDWKSPFHQTSDYQRLFYQYGFAMTPMPLAPQHPWWVVAAVYLAGLGIGMRAFLDGNRNTFARLSVFLSVLGIGLFTYYQGRSVDFNLMNAAWPAILLGFMLVDRLLRAIRAGIFPRGMCWLALPAGYLGVMAVMMFPATAANIWSFGSKQWPAAMAGSPVGQTDAMEERVAFIRTHAGKDSECVILADYQAVYFVETGFRSSMDAPGLSEIFFLEDVEKIRAALMRNPPRHLFVDEATLARLELTGAVRDHFRQVSASPDGKLLYMEPR